MKYNIGECHAFNGDKYLEIGEIIKAYKGENNENLYDFLVINENGQFRQNNIKEENIVIFENKRPPLDKWIIENMEEINKVFGKNMNDYFLVMYNSLNEVEKDFDDLFEPNDNYLKKVLNKWIVVLG